MKLWCLLSEYRWPIFVGGLLSMSILSSGVLVWVATRPDAPRPIAGYYEAARAWDATEADVEASLQLGWSVHYELPADVPHLPGMPRPLDLRITTPDGEGVAGLTGRLLAIRPSDTRLNQEGHLTEIPGPSGHYRTMVRLDQPGTWEFRLDARQEAMRFVHTTRYQLADALPLTEAVPR